MLEDREHSLRGRTIIDVKASIERFEIFFSDGSWCYINSKPWKGAKNGCGIAYGYLANV